MKMDRRRKSAGNLCLHVLIAVFMFSATISEVNCFDCLNTENNVKIPTIAVIGTSGVGKSTVANYLAGFEKGENSRASQCT